MFAFILALILIYLILAAQFESSEGSFHHHAYRSSGHCRSTDFHVCRGITMNIFSQIGIIMLIGLVAKNGILDCRICNQKQEVRVKQDAAIRCCFATFVPILMTLSASTVLGLIPLAFATNWRRRQLQRVGCRWYVCFYFTHHVEWLFRPTFLHKTETV